MAAEAHEVKASIRIYLFIFAALGVLTIVTVAASKLQLTIAGAVVLALIIASVKGSLVAAYFMHLLHERKVLYALLALCAFFFLVLMLMPMWQTDETMKLINPVYKQLGETPPVHAPPFAAPHGADHGHEAADAHGH
jgi:cytochrome c oxidase subunit 4